MFNKIAVDLNISIYKKKRIYFNNSCRYEIVLLAIKLNL